MQNISWMILSAALIFSLSSCDPADSTYRIDSAEITDSADLIKIQLAETDTLADLSIQQWQQWAEPRWDDLYPDPITIGDMERNADDFDRFGRVAITPDSTQLLFSVTTYAIATTISLVGFFEVRSQEFSMFDSEGPGSLEEVAWSPDGKFLAYSMGTARARGDHLHVANFDDKSVTAKFAEQDIVARLEEEIAGYETGTDQPQGSILKPHFRDLEWDDNSMLSFTSYKYHREDQVVRWEFDVSSQQLIIREGID